METEDRKARTETSIRRRGGELGTRNKVKKKKIEKRNEDLDNCKIEEAANGDKKHRKRWR